MGSINTGLNSFCKYNDSKFSLLSISIRCAYPALFLGVILSSQPVLANEVLTIDNQTLTINTLSATGTGTGTALEISGVENNVTLSLNSADKTITGSTGVHINGGGNTFTNESIIIGTGTLLDGANAGISTNSPFNTINNSVMGIIRSNSDGIFARGQATINNEGLIETIASNGSGVYFTQNGVYNGSAGSKINASSYGISVPLSSSTANYQINNAGDIFGGESGLRLTSGYGSVNNQVGGSITADTNYGILIGREASVDIVNNGLIGSNTINAISFEGTGSNRLTLGTGSVLNGDVISSTADTNSIILTGSGSEDSNFVGTVPTNGIKSLTMRGDDWTLSGVINLTGSDTNTLVVEQGVLTLNGQTSSRGNVLASTGSTLKIAPGSLLTTPLLDIQNDARVYSAGTLTGDVNNLGTYAAYNAFNDGASSHSQINGNFINSGVLQLGGSEVGNTLTITGNYTGNNGSVVINGALGSDNSPIDHLSIQGDSLGQSSMTVNNIGGIGAQTLQGIEVISVGGGSDGVFTLNNRAVSGLYEYNLLKNTATGNWYLSSEALPQPEPEPQPEPQPDPAPDTAPDSGSLPDPMPIPSKPGLFRPEIGAYLGNQISAQRMFISSMYDRYIPGAQASAGGSTTSDLDKLGWVRIVARDENSEAAQGNLSLDTHSTMIQFGGDFYHQEDKGIHAGVMAGIGDSKTTSSAKNNNYNATGNVTGYNVGIYGTWFQNEAQQEDLYVDTWMQYNWFNNSVYGDNLNTENYRSQGVQASIETGYTLPFARNETREWVATPQAQVIYSTYDSENHTEAGGTRITNGSDDGVVSRLGIRIANRSHTTPESIQLYTELNWEKGKGADSLSFNGDSVSNDLPDNRYQAVVGMVGDASKYVQIWGQAGSEWGENSYSSYEGQVGVRVKW
jgi:autotransporter family porin